MDTIVVDVGTSDRRVEHRQPYQLVTQLCVKYLNGAPPVKSVYGTPLKDHEQAIF